MSRRVWQRRLNRIFMICYLINIGFFFFSGDFYSDMFIDKDSSIVRYCALCMTYLINTNQLNWWWGMPIMLSWLQTCDERHTISYDNKAKPTNNFVCTVKINLISLRSIWNENIFFHLFTNDTNINVLLKEGECKLVFVLY